ncbi:hypothetical protein NO1_1933 [Candidatus Termititenax aidoneus]|uniref:Uncharacterized protein n=1 Tax=Termititenax aidoneus TaxID=2218524 RepID=A0A388TD40_TERA1|nr:hypothetical protein NO1_1933 [Candidatus Termititenax aidoneus]
MGKYDLNGRELVITPSPFGLVLELKNAVIKALTERKLSAGSTVLDALNGKTELSPEMLDGFLQAILAVAGNSEVERLLMECAKRAYIGINKDKIDADYFDEVNNRRDYYPIMFNVLKENLEPFFAGAASLFPSLEKAATTNDQK